MVPKVRLVQPAPLPRFARRLQATPGEVKRFVLNARKNPSSVPKTRTKQARDAGGWEAARPQQFTSLQVNRGKAYVSERQDKKEGPDCGS